MNDEGVTLGELGRRLAGLGETLGGIQSKLENIPDWRDVQRVEDGTKERHGALAARVQDLEDGRRWLTRQIGAALVTGVAGLLVGVVGAVKAGIL
ncbi:holin [Arthrobacter phage Berka]|nr:holin [Arthrobacter phage Berka]